MWSITTPAPAGRPGAEGRRGKNVTMVTPEEARQLLVEHFAKYPPPISGDLYILSEWYEDDQDYLACWGSRRFLLEGRGEYAYMGNSAHFIDKRTGEIRTDLYNLSLRKIRKMTPVDVGEG